MARPSDENRAFPASPVLGGASMSTVDVPALRAAFEKRWIPAGDEYRSTSSVGDQSSGPRLPSILVPGSRSSGPPSAGTLHSSSSLRNVMVFPLRVHAGLKPPLNVS